MMLVGLRNQETVTVIFYCAASMGVSCLINAALGYILFFSQLGEKMIFSFLLGGALLAKAGAKYCSILNVFTLVSYGALEEWKYVWIKFVLALLLLLLAYFIGIRHNFLNKSDKSL